MSDAGTSDPEATLKSGIETLDRVLVGCGFGFNFERTGKGSGGRFASGKYVRDDRILELHFRHSLGLVTYHIGGASLDHVRYMRLLGVYGQNSYPDFPNGPLQSFQSLADDLRRYCGDFLSGDGLQFRGYAAELKRNPKLFSGLQ